MERWTKESIQALISRSDKAVERAILAVYARQTVDEQGSGATKYANGMGFSGADSEFFSSLAEQILRRSHRAEGHRLTWNQIEAARKAGIGKYWKQLLEVIGCRQ